MKYKDMEKLFYGIVDNEYDHVINENLEGMKRKLEYENLQSIESELRKKLEEELSDESKRILEDLINTIGSQTIIETEYYFTKGVIAGLTGLSFLKEFNIGMFLR